MVRELFYVPYILVSIPGLIFVATLYILRELLQYSMKSTGDTQLLNSPQQHTAAIHIYHCLCHVTKRNISLHFVLPNTAGHTATLH